MLEMKVQHLPGEKNCYLLIVDLSIYIGFLMLYVIQDWDFIIYFKPFVLLSNVVSPIWRILYGSLRAPLWLFDQSSISNFCYFGNCPISTDSKNIMNVLHTNYDPRRAMIFLGLNSYKCALELQAMRIYACAWSPKTFPSNIIIIRLEVVNWLL